MQTLDGDDVRLAFPTLETLVRGLADGVRKSSADPEDWPDRARERVRQLSAGDFRRLINDLVRLRETYPEEVEVRRLIAGMGWSNHAQSKTHDDALTLLEIIEYLAHTRQQRENAATRAIDGPGR